MATETTPKMVNIFYSRAKTMGYVFRSGRVVHFVDGKFTTTNKAEIAELSEECEANPQGNYYIDSEQLTIDADQLDPVALMYAKMLKQAREEVAAATNPARDMGETKQGKLEGVANTNSIRGLLADSSSPVAVPVGSIKVAATSATKL